MSGMKSDSSLKTGVRNRLPRVRVYLCTLGRKAERGRGRHFINLNLVTFRVRFKNGRASPGEF